MGNDNDLKAQPVEAVQQEAVAPVLEEQSSVAGEETSKESMPDSEQKRTAEVDEKVALDNSKNPERTAAYIEKLKEENRKLKESQGIREQSVFDRLRPQPAAYPALNQQQVEAVANQLVDANGYLDEGALNQALAQANARAVEAERRARNVEDKLMYIEETRQVREAHAVHPELDPQSGNYDPEFFNLVTDRLTRNMIDGKQESLLDAANHIKGLLNPTRVDAKAKAEAEQKFKEVQAQKDNAPIETGKGESRQTTANNDDLRRRTRTGGVFENGALDQRLGSYFEALEANPNR